MNIKKAIGLILVFFLFSISSCFASSDNWDHFDDYWCCEHCGEKTISTDIICSTCGEPMSEHKVFFNIVLESNLIFSRYDVNVYLDDKMVGTIKHGANMRRNYRLCNGEHFIRFEKTDNASVTGNVNFSITTDSEITIQIKAKRNEVFIDSIENKQVNQKYDVVFEHRINVADYSIAFDMDTNQFMEVEDYTSHDKIRRGVFEGSFHDGMILLHYSDGEEKKMQYIFENLPSNYDKGYYLYPLDESGEPIKHEFQFRNYRQMNSFEYSFNE